MAAKVMRLVLEFPIDTHEQGMGREYPTPREVVATVSQAQEGIARLRTKYAEQVRKYTTIVNDEDTDEEVKAAARKALAKLKGESEPAAEPDASDPNAPKIGMMA